MKKDLATIAKNLAKIKKIIAASKQADRFTKSKILAPLRRPKAVNPVDGMTIAQLLATTDSSRKSNAVRDRVTLVSFKPGGAKKDKIVAKTLTYDNNGPRLEIRPHTHWIQKKCAAPEDYALPFNKSRVQVSCNCPDYLYTYEYALNHHGAARIINSNGEYPILKNPTLQAGLCKHLWVLLSYAKKKNI